MAADGCARAPPGGGEPPSRARIWRFAFSASGRPVVAGPPDPYSGTSRRGLKSSSSRRRSIARRASSIASVSASIRAICAAISFRSGPILVAPSTQADAALDTVARALIAARSRDTGAVTPHKAIAAALGVSRDVVVGGYCAIVRGLIRSLQPADDGVEAGKVVELEVAQIRGVEIVAGDVDMIALPERLLKFAIAGRVQRHHAVVRLAGECGQVMVRCREREAGRQETPAPGSEVGAITDVRMRLGRVRHPRGAFRGQVRERADVAPRRPIAWLIPS